MLKKEARLFFPQQETKFSEPTTARRTSSLCRIHGSPLNLDCMISHRRSGFQDISSNHQQSLCSLKLKQLMVIKLSQNSVAKGHPLHVRLIAVGSTQRSPPLLRAVNSLLFGLLSSKDAKNVEHSLVRGARAWDGPLNMVSQGLSDGIDEIIGAASSLGLNLGSSP